MRTPAQPPALLVDFDDTAAERNAAEALLARFADGRWQGLREEFRRGAITMREYQERAFNGVEATIQEMEAEAAGLVKLRPGLGELYFYCQASGIQVAIITNSLEFYVRAILRGTPLERVPLLAVAARGGPGRLSFNYPHAWEGCLQPGWGNCKCRAMGEFVPTGARTVYVGDGASDLCASRHADFVFARSTLLDHCRALGLPHKPFEDFHGVLAALRVGIPGVWEPGPSAPRGQGPGAGSPLAP